VTRKAGSAAARSHRLRRETFLDLERAAAHCARYARRRAAGYKWRPKTG